MGQAWKEALLRAAGKMCRRRIKGGKARVVLNGENVIMGRAKRGIYAGKHIQFGNKVSKDGENRSRRSWKPNVHKKRLYSFALDQYIRIHVTAHALRCIDKAGGLDEYLVNMPDNKMENDLCLYWKRQIQSVNRYLYKLRSGNIPEELHKHILDDYSARLCGRKWEYPIVGNKEDDETRKLAPEAMSETISLEDEGTSEAAETPTKRRGRVMVFSRGRRTKNNKKSSVKKAPAKARAKTRA